MYDVIHFCHRGYQRLSPNHAVTIVCFFLDRCMITSGSLELGPKIFDTLLKLLSTILNPVFVLWYLIIPLEKVNKQYVS